MTRSRGLRRPKGSKELPSRSARVSDPIWKRAVIRAKEEDTTVSAVIVAFLDGYGPDPRDAGAWHRDRVRAAIGTAVWAHRVGDEPFEAQGHRMIAEALSSYRA
jgi:hypothetical protein